MNDHLSQQLFWNQSLDYYWYCQVSNCQLPAVKSSFPLLLNPLLVLGTAMRVRQEVTTFRNLSLITIQVLCSTDVLTAYGYLSGTDM